MPIHGWKNKRSSKGKKYRVKRTYSTTTVKFGKTTRRYSNIRGGPSRPHEFTPAYHRLKRKKKWRSDRAQRRYHSGKYSPSKYQR